MKLIIELDKSDIKSGMRTPRIDKITMHDFSGWQIRHLIEKAEYVVYTSPKGKKKVIKNRIGKLGRI